MNCHNEQLLRQRNADLEQQLTEKTTELREKNRALEIEATLERVRRRAMAMQSSDELSTLIGTLFTELTKRDLVLTRCIIRVFEPATKAARCWMANVKDPSHPINFYLKYHDHPAYLTFVKEWRTRVTVHAKKSVGTRVTLLFSTYL